MSLLPIILQHLQHEREPIDRWLLASELAKLDRLRKLHDAKGEQPVTQGEFDDQIGIMVLGGILIEADHKVRLVVAKAEQEIQRELF